MKSSVVPQQSSGLRMMIMMKQFVRVLLYRLFSLVLHFCIICELRAMFESKVPYFSMAYVGSSLFS